MARLGTDPEPASAPPSGPMPHLPAITSPRLPDELPRPLIEGTRVDPPHVMGDPADEASGTAPIPAAADDCDWAGAEASTEAVDPLQSDFPRLRAQAEQISAYLRKRQRDLDLREARLNSQLAEYDQQVRSARGWFLQRRDELLEREREIAAIEARLAARQAEAAPAAADLEHREAEVARRQAELEAAEHALDARRAAVEADLDARRTELEQQTAREAQVQQQHREAAWATIRRALAQLEQRREALESQAADLAARSAAVAAAEAEVACRAASPLPEELARAAKLDAREQRLAVRERHLGEAEGLLEHGRAQLAELRQELEAQRERLAEQARADRRRLAEAQRSQETELGEQRAALERASEQLDHRRGALLQSQQEVSQLHRETLELRLATEELWSELAGAAPPAALASALSATRARLADHYRLERGEIARQRAELEALAVELGAQHDHLRRQADELQDWLAGRQAELERQAAALAARELDLDRQQAESRAAEARWHGQRFELEQEVRRLSIELHRAAES